MDFVSPMYVANSILDIAFEKHIPCNPMKLQRLLYLVYASYLQKTGRRLFSDRFQTWAYGPVILSVYWKFQCFRTRPIDRYAADATGSIVMLDPASSTALRHALSDVAAVWLPMTPTALCEVVRQDGSAWMAAYQSGNESLDDAVIARDPCCRL